MDDGADDHAETKSVKTASIAWTDDGAPRALAFDDIYFVDRAGRDESRHVFLAGNALPARWRGRDHFSIGELGFGVGLNFLETWALWETTAADRPATARLDYLSFERFPPSAVDLRRAIGLWPELLPRADALLAGVAAATDAEWPPEAGWRPVSLANGVALILAIGDATTMAPAWSPVAPEAIDAWYLDGFSPAKNPDLWGEALFAALAARTAPDGTAASYTAAGWVRRNLAAAGFSVEKRPGFGTKREMIAARRAEQ